MTKTHGFGPYAVFPENAISDGMISVRAIEPPDIEQVRLWRNAQMDVLRQTEVITPDAQAKYFEDYVWPLKKLKEPAQILLAIEKSGELIGYGGLVHICWRNRRAEVSFLLSPNLESERLLCADYFSRYITLIKKLAFCSLKFERLTTETFAFRNTHINVLEQSGFANEGSLRGHVLLDGIRVDSLVHGALASEYLIDASHRVNHQRHCDSHRQISRSFQNVLITSASKKVSLVNAVKRATKEICPEIKVIAGDCDGTVTTRYTADEFWQMPNAQTISLNELQKACIRREIGVILPTRDGELLFWAKLRYSLASAGINVIVSSLGGAQRCIDKLAFAKWGKENNLPIIPASVKAEEFPDQLLVVKERFGAGSKGIRLRLKCESANNFARSLNSPIFQPFIQGREISIDGYITRSGKVHGVVLRWRDRVVFGESEVTTTFRDSGIEKTAARILNKLDLFGPVVMQGILTDHGLQVIEVNARFGGASSASLEVGLDSIYWALLEARDPEAVLPPFRRREGEVRQVRVTKDIIIHDPSV